MTQGCSCGNEYHQGDSIRPGIYCCPTCHEMHIDGAEFLAGHGLEVTKANLDRASELALRMASEHGILGDVVIEDVG